MAAADEFYSEMKTVDRAAVRKAFKEVHSILANVTSSDSEIEDAVSQLGEVLYRCVQCSDVDARNTAFDVGIVKVLMGILICSSNVSILSKVANCLALLVHGNEEARERLGSMRDLFRLLVTMLSPRVEAAGAFTESQQRVCWELERMEVYEKVLSVFRKLTYLNGDNQVRLTQCGTIKLIVNLCTSDMFLRNCGQFSRDSKQCLERLTLGKKLACRTSCVPKNSSGVVLSSFQALSGEYSIVTAQYPAFYVSLATNERNWISCAMIERGVVWPDHTPFPTEGSKWTQVMVMHVENGSNVWCQFCKEKVDPEMEELKKSLEDLPPPLVGSSPDFPLAPGDVYAAYCELDRLDSPSSLSSDRWCRARLLRVLPGSDAGDSKQAVILAVDYGFMMTIPDSHLEPLPPQCRGIPPQAVPCRLMGVAPLPPSTVILEHIAAILRNLAFESSACRVEIAALHGIEALLELCQCPNGEIAQQSMCALLNMSSEEKMRAKLGQRGVVSTLLRVCQRSTTSEELLNQTLHCLLNLLSQCSENFALFAKDGGDKILRDVLVKYGHNREITECIGTILKRLPPLSHPTNTCSQATRNLKNEYTTGNTAPLSPSKPVYSKRRSLDTARPPKHPNAFKRANSVPSAVKLTTLSPHKKDSSRRQMYEARRKANGERVRPNPMYRCRGDSEQSEGSSSEAESEIVMQGGQKDLASETSGSVLISKCYLVNCALPGGPECESRCFVAVEDIAHVSRRQTRRTVCAMMNVGKTSTIFIGVRKDGMVKGVKLNKKQRDSLLIGIDRLMSDFTPTITSNLYTVHFVPVAVQMNGSRRLAIVDDYFVVELTLMELPCGQIYTISEFDSKHDSLYDRCYYRVGSCNVQLSYQELRDTLASRVASSYAKEISMLESTLNNLKMKRRSDTV